jgi:voltage-gated potassium channel
MLNFSEKIQQRMKNTVVWGVIAVSISFSANVLLWVIESKAGNADLQTSQDMLWWWINTAFGLSIPAKTVTPEGYIISIFVVISGFLLLSLFLSGFSDIFRMIYERNEQGNIKVRYSGHIIIFGYTSLTAGVIKLLRRYYGNKIKLVLITNDADTNPFQGQVDFISDNPISQDTLSDANVAGATAAIILANDRFRDPDTYSLAIASGIEQRNSKVTTIIELVNPDMKAFFKKAGADGFILRMEVLSDLLDKNTDPKLIRIISKESNLVEDEDATVDPELI